MRLKDYLRGLRRRVLSPFNRVERKFKKAAQRFIVKTVEHSYPTEMKPQVELPTQVIAPLAQMAVPASDVGGTKLLLAFLKASQRNNVSPSKGMEAVSLGDGRMLVPHPTCGFMYSDTSNVKVLPQLVLRSYQEQATIAIEREFKSGDCVIQLGAGQGYHTLAIATSIGKAGRVLALENRTSELALLRNNVEAHCLEDRVHICDISHEDPFPFAQFLVSHRTISAIYVSPDHEIPEAWINGLTEFFRKSATTILIVGTRRETLADYVAKRNVPRATQRRAA